MSDSPLPLAGIRVIEVGTYIFGPAAATVMSDFGGEVIKIEPPGMGDPYRHLHMIHPMPPSDRPYCFMLDGRNKKSVVVDLKQDAGREIVRKLVRDADVFLTNYHPSVLESMHLTYDDLAPLNERLIYAHATGYGETGPEVEKPGYDMTAWWARSGLMDSLRPADDDPCLSVAGMGDHPSSIALFSAIMLALYTRSNTGRGSKVSTSLMANGVWSNSCHIQAILVGAPPYVRQRRTDAGNALVNHYQARDGKRFILCGIRADRDWVAACRAIEREDLLEDARFNFPESRKANVAQLIAVFDDEFRKHDMAHWLEAFHRCDLTFSPVSQPADLPNDAQLNANGVFVDAGDPGNGGYRTITSPIAMRGVDKVRPTPAPTLGEHTREVLDSIGYSPAEIEGLARSKVIAGSSS